MIGKYRKYLFWFCLWTAVGISYGSNQEAPKSSVSTSQIFELLSNYFKDISTLSFSTQLNYTRDPKTVPASAFEGPQDGSFSFDFDGARYRIEDRTATGPQGEQFRSLIAYDGEKYQRLHYAEGLLWIKSIKPTETKPSEAFLRYSNMLFQVFEFLLPQLVENDFSEMNVQSFKNAALAANLENRLINTPPISITSQEVIFYLKAGTEALTGLPSKYKVTLSKEKGFLPTSWERIDNEGNTVASLKVLEFGEIKLDGGQNSVFYPKKVLRSFYGGGQSFPIQKTPVFSVEATIEDFNVNSDISDKIFQIDPVSAAKIQDADNNLYIEVL